MDTETGEMIVKRVSVPIGLEELMEGLVKEVLLKKPDDIYQFAARYFAHLLTIRDQVPIVKTKTLRSAQTVKSEKPSKYIKTSRLSKQFSIREETDIDSPIISQKPKMYQRNELKYIKRRHTGPPTVLPNNHQVTIRRKYARTVSGDKQKDGTETNNNKNKIQSIKERSSESSDKNRSNNNNKIKKEANNNNVVVAEVINKVVETPEEKTPKFDSKNLNKNESETEKNSVVQSESLKDEKKEITTVTKEDRTVIETKTSDTENETTDLPEKGNEYISEEINSEKNKIIENQNEIKPNSQTEINETIKNVKNLESENIPATIITTDEDLTKKRMDENQEQLLPPPRTVDEDEISRVLLSSISNETLNNKSIETNLQESNKSKSYLGDNKIPDEELSDDSLDHITIKNSESVTKKEDLELNNKNKEEIRNDSTLNIEKELGMEKISSGVTEDKLKEEDNISVSDQKTEMDFTSLETDFATKEEDFDHKEVNQENSLTQESSIDVKTNYSIDHLKENNIKDDLKPKEENKNHINVQNDDIIKNSNDLLEVSTEKNVKLERPKEIVDSKVADNFNKPLVDDKNNNNSNKNIKEEEKDMSQDNSLPQESSTDLITDLSKDNVIKDDLKSKEENTNKNKSKDNDNIDKSKDLLTTDLIIDLSKDNVIKDDLKSKEENTNKIKTKDNENIDILGVQKEKVVKLLEEENLTENKAVDKLNQNLLLVENDIKYTPNKSADENQIMEETKSIEVENKSEIDSNGKSIIVTEEHTENTVKDKNEIPERKITNNCKESIEVKENNVHKNDNENSIKSKELNENISKKDQNEYNKTEVIEEKIENITEVSNKIKNDQNKINECLESNEDNNAKEIEEQIKKDTEEIKNQGLENKSVKEKNSGANDKSNENTEIKNIVNKEEIILKQNDTIKVENESEKYKSEENIIKSNKNDDEGNKTQSKNKSESAATNQNDVFQIENSQLNNETESKSNSEEKKNDSKKDFENKPLKTDDTKNELLHNDSINIHETENVDNNSETKVIQIYDSKELNKKEPTKDIDQHENSLITESFANVINSEREVKKGIEEIENKETVGNVQLNGLNKDEITIKSDEKVHSALIEKENTIKDKDLEKQNNSEKLESNNENVTEEYKREEIKSEQKNEIETTIKVDESQNKKGPLDIETPSADNINENVINSRSKRSVSIEDELETTNDASKNTCTDENLINRVAKNYVNYVIDNDRYLLTDSDVSAIDEVDLDTNNDTDNNTDPKSDESQNDLNISDKNKELKNETTRKEDNLTKLDDGEYETLRKTADNLVNSTLSIAQTGLIEHKVKKFLNDFIDREKEPLSSKNEVNSPRPLNKMKSFDITNKYPHNGMKKSTSFDSSKLRNEIKKIEEEAKVTNFKNSYNPFLLRKEIQDATKKDFSVTSINFREVVDAVLKIQKAWRLFQKKKLEERKVSATKDTLKVAEAAIIIQKMWKGFKVRKHLKSKDKNLETYKETSEIDKPDNSSNENQEYKRLFSADSTASINTVIFNDPKEHTEDVGALLDEILDYPTVEEEYLLDNYQSKLLDKISGKEKDSEDDIKAYEKLVSPRKIDLEQLKEEVHIPLVPKIVSNVSEKKLTRSVGSKLDILEEETSPIEEANVDDEKEFCSEPKQLCGVEKLIDGKPLSDYVEIISPDDNKLLNKDAKSSGEVHETLVIPLPDEVKDQLNKFDNTRSLSTNNSIDVKNLDSISSILSTAGIDSQEIHDTIAVPVNESNVDIGRSQPISVQICQTSGQVFLIIILPPFKTNIADAENLMTASAPSTKNVTERAGDGDAQDPGKGDLLVDPQLDDNVASESVPESMESEKRRKTDGSNMEAQAATKIQAGFRGYQVRKQLKLKNNSSDKSPTKKPNRSKTSGSLDSSKDGSPKEDIEEQSAVKIQAGIRGFLVRRRQKKLNQQA